MELTISDAFLLVGLIQGICIVVLALRAKKVANPLAHRFFGMILVCFTLSTFGAFRIYILNDYLQSTLEQLIFGFFPYFLFLAIGPSLYFYIQHLVGKPIKAAQKWYLHYLPVTLEVASFLIGLFTGLLHYLQQIEIDQTLTLASYLVSYEKYLAIPRVISISYYLLLSWRYVFQHREYISSAIRRWLTTMLIIISAFNLIYIPASIILHTSLYDVIFEEMPRLLIYLVYYPIIGFIYFLSIQYMRKKIPWVNHHQKVSQSTDKLTMLRKLMEEEQLYRNDSLKLKELSEHAGIPAKEISHLLNHHFQKGFNDYINEYRIKDAIHLMENDALKRMTLEGLALEVGFSSRTTFYRAFKKVMKQSPTEYLKQG